MTPREELQRLADSVRLDLRSVDDAIHQAYLVGLEAYRDQILGAPSVWRIVDSGGDLVSKRRYKSQLKRLYPNQGDAKRALQFAPDGATVQAGRVEWEDIG